MADGLNHARAMRVAELLNDYRSLHYYITQLQAEPRTDEYYLEGYTRLRYSIAEAQSVLTHGYDHDSQDPDGDVEVEKSLLLMVLLDGAVRRFICQRAYLRAVVCKKWVDARAAILRGRRADTNSRSQVRKLLEIDGQLATDLASLTDSLVFTTLEERDMADGKYLDDDPDLDTITQQLLLRGS